MPTDIIPTIVNLTPQVAIVFLFLWFKTKEDKRNQRREEVRDTSFLKAINATTLAVTKGMDLVGEKIEVVDRKVDKIHEDHKENKEIIKSMYQHSKTLAEALKNKPNGKVEVTVNR